MQMNRNRLFFSCLFLIMFLFVPAQTIDIPADVAKINAFVKLKYAPDGRVAIFKPVFSVDGKNILVSGTTTSSKARQELLVGLKKAGYQALCSMRVLPEEANLGEACWGIVRNSVCNLRSAPDYAAENVTQAQMGMPVRIIQKDKWLQVQTCDNYLGWVENSAIQRVTKFEMEAWNKADKVVVTALWGQVFREADKTSPSMGDVVAGNRLKMIGKKGKFYHVEYGDGRQGYISKTICEELKKWRKKLDNSPQGILRTAQQLTGIPYIWAGFSPKGADCSGFVRTVLYMHDIIIPRDASQMCLMGQRLEIGDFSQLEPGDLLFFGTRNDETGKEKVSHVGFYMGNKRFIHSLGNVHENSFDSASDIYDEYNLKRLLFASRILPYINQHCELNTTDNNPYFSKSLKF